MNNFSVPEVLLILISVCVVIAIVLMNFGAKHDKRKGKWTKK